jgi:hypothetical protein
MMERTMLVSRKEGDGEITYAFADGYGDYLIKIFSGEKESVVELVQSRGRRIDMLGLQEAIAFVQSNEKHNG